MSEKTFHKIVLTPDNESSDPLYFFIEENSINNKKLVWLKLKDISVKTLNFLSSF